MHAANKYLYLIFPVSALIYSTMSTLLRSFLLCILFTGSMVAQGQLLSPEEFLGYTLGDRFTPHHRVVAYLEQVASHAAHVELVPYGTTYEGRPLLYAIVSSPENMARRETIRTNNLRLSGILDGPPIGFTPAIVWLSYNVHGNESASTEAAMSTLHALASADNGPVQAWLENTIVILDPCVNPDGRDRYVHFFQRTAGRHVNVHPAAREHREPWPGGRTNHYYFDLNRDWAWGSQLETQQRLPHYNRWMPHIHVDFHEQGVDEPYYFAPAAEPYHATITPWQRTLQELIGRNHARYFDANGWLYFTRQVYDLFYPGYGDTWPMFNGAIGMTYEQGGSGRAGLGIITSEGDTLSLRNRMEHHYTTGLSTIEVAATHHEQITQEFANYFEQSRASPVSHYTTFVIKPAGNPDKLTALARHLDLQGITYGRAGSTQQEEGFSFMTREERLVRVEPGDMVVSTLQPKGVLASVLFEPEAALSDSLSYDITAWALPYVYGLQAYALEAQVQMTSDSLVQVEKLPALAHPTAYLAEWRSFADAQFLARLLNEGIQLRFTEKPFAIDNRRYDRGTLILTRSSNNDLGNRFDQIVREAAAESGQRLHSVVSTQVADGVDFGSSDVPFLKKPRVAIVAGSEISPYALGELWHYFDQQLAYPVTLVNADNLGGLHLYHFDVIILPGGSYEQILDDERLKKLQAWIGDGGRLIALEAAARFLADKDGFALKKKEPKKEEEEKGDNDNDDALRTYAERDRHAISEQVIGAIFRVQLDATHPLAFGYDETYFTLKRNETAFAFLPEGWNVGTLGKNARISGFVGAKVLDPLEESLLFGVQTRGKGEIIYLLDNPVFRGFWYNGRLLLANAVFLTGQRTPGNF